MSMRESIFSIGSRLIQRHDDDISFDVMNLDDLHQTHSDLLQEIWMLTLENDMYERYLSRQDPHGLKTIKNVLDRAKITRRVTAHLLPRSSRMSFRESVINVHDPGRYSVVSTPSIVSMPSVSRLGATSIMTVGTTGDSPKSEYQVNSFEAGPSEKCHWKISCKVEDLQRYLCYRITIAHRMFMARKEVEEMKRKLEQMQVFVRKKKATMRAKIEEIEIRISEAHESTAESGDCTCFRVYRRIVNAFFTRDFSRRFIEEWLRSANTILERLRLKSATLRMLIRKARQQLAQRKELGELLHAVDFEKLSIENQDYAKMLEEKNLYVIDMKRIAGYYHLKLTQHKQKLGDLLRKLNEVKSEIITKQDQIKELKIEQRVVEVKVKRQNRKLQNLLSFMDNHVAPDILEFVHIQVECRELDKTYKLLQRRRNIEKIIFEEYRKQSQIRKKSRMDEEARQRQ
uniref:coiled-coil domain-containing protein 113 n=1 Tax=Bombus vancouverensis nearcticus TaxID=2705178 RepID=UPI00143AAC35|nr:coiled-coil domain-containing protein 113 [Bombus vancouverensis nearcticus]